MAKKDEKKKKKKKKTLRNIRSVKMGDTRLKKRMMEEALDI